MSNIDIMKRDFSVRVTPTNFGRPETSWIIGSDIEPVTLVEDGEYRIFLIIQRDNLKSVPIIVLEDRRGQDDVVTIHPLPPGVAEIVSKAFSE